MGFFTPSSSVFEMTRNDTTPVVGLGCDGKQRGAAALAESGT